MFGNDLVKEILGDVIEYKTIPIECHIPTGNADPISWSRPIRSERDEHDFLKLVDDLESRGIIEPSTSVWNNPVV